MLMLGGGVVSVYKWGLGLGVGEQSLVGGQFLLVAKPATFG